MSPNERRTGYVRFRLRKESNSSFALATRYERKGLKALPPQEEQMRTKHLAASGVIGFLLALMPLLDAHAGIWRPTLIPGVLMKYCLCQSITGRAEVSSPSKLSPLTLIGLWRDLDMAVEKPA